MPGSGLKASSLCYSPRMRPLLPVSRLVSRNGLTPFLVVVGVVASMATHPVFRNGLTPFLPSLDAQVRPVYDRGAAGLTQVLQRLQTTASALHTGAHPDDEDSAFIARAARGDHARVAYLSLTRGEGGQN